MAITRKDKRALQLAAMGINTKPRKGSKAAKWKIAAEEAMGICRTMNVPDSKIDNHLKHFLYAKECFANGRYESAYGWAKEAIKAGAINGAYSDEYRKALALTEDI